MLTLYAALDSGPAPTRSGQSFKDGYCDSMLGIFFKTRNYEYLKVVCKQFGLRFASATLHHSAFQLRATLMHSFSIYLCVSASKHYFPPVSDTLRGAFYTAQGLDKTVLNTVKVNISNKISCAETKVLLHSFTA